MGGNIGRERAQILQVTRERLGVKTFRPGQEEAIVSVLEGCDTHRGDADRCGQVCDLSDFGFPAAGPTVVISPLIALQQDQVGALANQDASAAALMNSAARSTERNDAFEHLEDGVLEFVFPAP